MKRYCIQIFAARYSELARLAKFAK